ncbi:unnamed protein product [Acanthosepion pharaonis]|uniref:DUF7041 domain-containing protein n=1 Tax=Acanthosepion pharaonis TaxID=158019 RepID=A0A812D8D1_ACAPH|nr:unnamed protein product [Sepia pharaonis]
MADPIQPTEAALRMELPTYNMNAQTWFIQLDAIFQARHVTSQQSKFAFVVEKLPAEMAAEVADVLINLPPEKPYEVLRQAILQRTGCSEERKIKDLLTNVTLGNSKPSQLLRRMITLLGNNTISETVLKQMWLEKLQPDIVQILAVLTEVDVHKLASIADKIVDTRPIRQISSVAPSDDPTPDVNQQLHVLTAELKSYHYASTVFKVFLDEVAVIQLTDTIPVGGDQRREKLVTIREAIAGTMKCLVPAQGNVSHHVLIKTRETPNLAANKGVGR